MRQDGRRLLTALTMVTAAAGVAAVAVVAVPATALAARAPRPAFTAYFSWPDASGTATVAGVSREIDVKYSDVLENFDVWRAAAQVEQWPGRVWGYLVDGAYSQAEAFAVDENVGVTGSLDFRRAHVQAAALYRVGEWGLGGVERSATSGPYRGLILDVLGGARWAYLKQKISPASEPSIGGSEDWFEPYVGGRVFVDVTRMLGVRLQGDVGGFGVGSDLTWMVWAEIDFALSPANSLTFGYRIDDMNYEKGSGDQRFGIDGQARGPTLGFAFRF